MRKAIGATVGALLVLALAPLVVAGKKTVPQRVVQAKRVVLGYDLGDRFVADNVSAPEPGVGPSERRTLQAVRDELARWGRYTVVTKPEEAGRRLWRASQADGLAGPAPQLVAKFRGDVDRTPPTGGHDPAKPPQ
jgi:hypothetical protein